MKLCCTSASHNVQDDHIILTMLYILGFFSTRLLWSNY